MGTIHRALKVRLYPNKEQETLILKTLGSCRFLYNQMLAERINVYEKLKDQEKQVLWDHKYKSEVDYKNEFDWMREVDATALQQSRADLAAAYQNFFRSLSGKRKGKAGFPKFHKRGRKDSYRAINNNNGVEVNFEKSKVKLPKLGWITFRDGDRKYEGKIKNATISRTKTGKYFVSVLYEQELELQGVLVTEGLKTKGLDMSLSDFFVDDEGKSPAYERIFRKYQPRLAHYQRRCAKKKKGSNNRKKAQLRVNRVYEKIANSRKDFSHQLSAKLIRENDVIVVETLNLRAMAQCLNLGKSVNDLGYGEFLTQLKYKALWNNKTLIQADKWFASSKTCSHCGFVHKSLQLSDRQYICPKCGFEIERDHNAGINLKQYGLKELGLIPTDRREFKPVESKTSAKSQDKVSLVVEAGILLALDNRKFNKIDSDPPKN